MSLNVPVTDLQILKLPRKMHKRGRPKGAGLTVIGLPSKKARKASTSTKPVPFLKISEWDRTKGILIHFYNNIITSTINFRFFYISHAWLVC